MNVEHRPEEFVCGIICVRECIMVSACSMIIIDNHKNASHAFTSIPYLTWGLARCAVRRVEGTEIDQGVSSIARVYTIRTPAEMRASALYRPQRSGAEVWKSEPTANLPQVADAYIENGAYNLS